MRMFACEYSDILHRGRQGDFCCSNGMHVYSQCFHPILTPSKHLGDNLDFVAVRLVTLVMKKILGGLLQFTEEKHRDSPGCDRTIQNHF